VDGQAVTAAEATRLFRYHKPAGLMTTHRDPKGRATVFEALPPGLPRLISVGRLDLTSEGLLLLTNDGGLARALELPSSGWKRRYRARAFGRIDQKRLDALKDGLTVEGVHYGPIEASLDKVRESAGGGSSGANVWITLVLAEGKNREVRRVLEALGLKVNRLIRLAYGPFALGPLAPGAVEEVGPRVIREQLGELIAPASLPMGEKPLWRTPATAVAAKAPTRRAPKPAEPPKRKVYKAGWAKAKPPRR
jgi:23S rRNA pseudouridine2605 synthase